MDNDKDKLKNIFIEIFKDIDEETFDFNKDRSEFEDWDSLTHMQLISEVESVFKVSFEVDEIVDINKPEDLIILIQKKQND
jgi:acyl carrier protein